VKLPTAHLIVASAAVIACSGGQPTDAAPVASETPLRAESCREEVDATDPNATPYLLCPGVAGYSLIVRSVDSGRQSIEVVDPAKRTFPLDYHEFVTRNMADLGGQAQWWVQQRAGQSVPVALAVRVNAHEDDDDPAQVTSRYIAVAKILPEQACVIERIADGPDAQAAVRKAVQSAPEAACAPALPPMAVDGDVVR
jgi:hypothetical protein